MKALYIFLILPFLFLTNQIMAQTNISTFPLTGIHKANEKHLIFYLTGDGGMNSFSKQVTEGLAQKGYSVISLDTRKYFWTKKTPDRMAQDMNSILEHHLKTWEKAEFSIVGYSFGADAAIFLVPRLNKDLQQKLRSTVLLSPSTSTDLVVKVSNLLGFSDEEGEYKTLPELNKVSSPVLSIFGKEEESEFYKAMKVRQNHKKVLIPGSHKFNNDINKVVATILEGL